MYCSCALSNPFCRQRSNWLSALAPLLVAIIKSNFSCTYYISSPAYRASLREGYDFVLLFSAFTSFYPPGALGRGSPSWGRAGSGWVSGPTGRHRDTSSCLLRRGNESMSSVQLQKALSLGFRSELFFNWTLDTEALDNSKSQKPLTSLWCLDLMTSSRLLCGMLNKANYSFWDPWYKPFTHCKSMYLTY